MTDAVNYRTVWWQPIGDLKDCEESCVVVRSPNGYDGYNKSGRRLWRVDIAYRSVSGVWLLNAGSPLTGREVGFLRLPE